MASGFLRIAAIVYSTSPEIPEMWVIYCICFLSSSWTSTVPTRNSRSTNHRELCFLYTVMSFRNDALMSVPLERKQLYALHSNGKGFHFAKVYLWKQEVHAFLENFSSN